VIGKVGTDIEDAKCCWMVCTALQLADPEQQEIIKVGVGNTGEVLNVSCRWWTSSLRC
jgi:farnesyl diphosphate synthase